MGVNATTKKTVYLKDYLESAYIITRTDLDIDLHPTVTTVKSLLTIQKNPKSKTTTTQLELHGDNLILKQVKLDSKILSSNEYSCNANNLIISQVPDAFELEIVNQIKPQENTALSGLYQSNGMYCTQCEAEGFRRITYYLDRPDVMSKFKVTIHADKKTYPVLLANGNLVAQGADSDTRHYAVWEDPFFKPSYLFAMVAGDLIAVEDNFVTMSGRIVKLKLYVERENLDQSAHAMQALKKAMAWDEEAYGREYDLDIYMIVAVNDFNMGAMENKGLNIFNAKYVLASPATASDADFENIDSVIGHEYFHNWSGNRVTCRDWFQLSLKEGFTVFREQQFTQYITQSPVCRIEQIKLLMARQFTEDAGPLAHPVRPDSYMEINNFYTMTIYEKGAEVIGMLHTILGPKKFRQGTDLYFARHDGQAVTTDDFVAAMQDASGIDLTQFKRWYTQAGTPEVTVFEEYDAATKVYTLKLAQYTPDTPDQINKLPLYIPISIGLLDSAGKDMPLDSTVLSLTETEQSFVFKNIAEKPKLSILRNFSAPVRIKHKVSAEQLAFMLAHDSDNFNRWYAGQQLYLQTIMHLIDSVQHDRSLKLPDLIVDSFKAVLLDKTLNVSLKAELLTLPSTTQIIDAMQEADPDAIYIAKKFVLIALANKLHKELLHAHEQYVLTGPYKYTAHDAAFRNCKNVILFYLTVNKSVEAVKMLTEQYYKSNNMTDTLAAMACLVNIDCPARGEILDDFYQKWQHNPLVINKWLTLQTQSDLDNVLQQVQALTEHVAFDIKNPNKVYALLGGFSAGNPVKFHVVSGAGYKFLTDMIIKLNALNPQIAARLLTPLTQWQKFNPVRQKLMCSELIRIKQTPNLSTDVLEIVSKTLENYVCK